MQLYKLADNYTEALQTIQALFESGEIDGDSAADTIEGLQGELQEKAINVALHIKNLRSDLEQLELAKKSFDSRIKSVESSLEFYESYLDNNMQKAGLQELKTAQVLVKYKKLPAIVEITGEVPAEFQRVVPETREPDKRAIGEALKAGIEVIGALLVDGRTRLEIK